MADRKQGLLKDGTRRPTANRGGRGGGMPRIMWLAILVCVAGAVFLFRSQNTAVPTGIGENRTVVTAPDVESTLDQESAPRSGEVDIGAETAPLTPEKPESGAAVVSQPAAKPRPAAATPVRSTPPADSATRPAEPVLPADNGPYVVQIGSFGNAENADREAARLRKLGWDALVKMGNTSTGAIIQRVHIGYFKSRADAEEFIRQNRQQMSKAIAVHR